MKDTAVILVVDDNEENRTVIDEMLSCEGYGVLLASDGLQGLELAQREIPDLILLDNIMPGMDGVEVCRNLKKDPVLKKIPVIFFSGVDSASQKLQAFSEGAVDYITKPFHINEVLARVRTHLQLVQQAELEAKNIELRRSHDVQKQLLEQYTALFDFAPVGYVTMDRAGRILTINLAGAGLLGIVRSHISKQPFSRYVAPEDHWRLAEFLDRTFSQRAGKTVCELNLISEGRPPLVVQMEGLAKGSGRECLVAVTDVTELRLEEQKFHIVADNTFDWEFWRAPDGSFIYNSPSCRTVTGYDPDLFLGDPGLFLRIIHPEDQDAYLLHMRDFEDGHLEHEADFRVITAAGEVRWLAHACRPVYDRQSLYLGVRGSNRDITARKLAEMIMQSRLRLSGYMTGRTVDDLLTKVLDEAEELTDSSIGFFHFLGDDQETLTLQAWSSRTLSSMCTAEGKGHRYPLEKAGVWCDCIRVRGPVVHNDYASMSGRNGLPPGHAPVLRELVVPIFARDRIVAVLGVGNKVRDYTDQDVMTIQQLADLAWDIVERRQAEETVKSSELRFRSLFEGMNEGVALHTFIYDDDGRAADYRVVTVNRAYESILGLSREAVVGRTGCEVYGTPVPPYLDEYQSVLESRAGLSFETYFPPMERYFNISVIPWDDTGFATFFADISERKKSEQQLKMFNKSLEEQVARAVDDMRRKEQSLILQERRAVMGEMINNIAHQWRQPLNVLGLNLQELPYAYEAGTFDREYLKNSVDESMLLISGMSRTIDEFRSFFRSDSEITVFSINRVIESTVSLIGDGFRDRHITIDFQAEGDPVVSGYPNEYAQALLNIIINARDALTAKQVDDARITLRSFAENGRSVVIVADNAGGISDDIIDRLFDPYFTTKGPDKGTGIGLFMSLTIIEKNMGGRLSVRNNEGGAEFRIEL